MTTTVPDMTTLDHDSISATRAGDITILLRDLARGDARAEARLFGRTYRELLSLARWFARRERRGGGITGTSLVNDAFIRLARSKPEHYENRRHFFGCFREAMRRICIERARVLKALKNGGGEEPMPLLDEPLGRPGPDLNSILAVVDALERLALAMPRAARVVRLRFIEGRTEQEVAEELKVCRGTVQSDWRFAKAWLRRELGGGFLMQGL